MKLVSAIGAGILVSLAGTAAGQCGTPCTEPGDCPPSSIQSFGYFSPACCVVDTSTTRLCSKYTTTYTTIDCEFTGVVSALANTASTATYSSTPGGCVSSFNNTDTPTPCADTGPSADLDAGQSSSATACSSASAGPVSSSHYAHFSVSASSIEAVTSSRVTNVVNSYYDNCACEDAGSASGIGAGYAQVNTVGGIGYDCEPGGQIVADHDTSAGSQIVHRNAARNVDCDGCDPCRPGSGQPVISEIARKTLVERDAAGNIVATHTDTFFLVEYDDGTSHMQNTLDVYENAGRSGSRLITLSPKTTSFDIIATQQTSGAPVTWNTWIALTESAGTHWADADYRLEAGLNMDGYVDNRDAELIFEHRGALDVDGNGTADAKDAAAMLAILASGELAGDLNFDGRIDVGDFIEWKNAYQTLAAN